MKRLSGLLFILVIGALVWGDDVSFPQGESIAVNGRFQGTGGQLSGWLMRSGGYGSFELTAPQTGSPDAVLTIKVKRGDPKPWGMELRQPVAAFVPKGCIMVISFEYKMTEGYSYQFYWQEERPPWPKLLSMRLTSPVNAWHRVRVAAPVHANYDKETTSFSFHLAEAQGILQLRNFQAVLVPGTVSLDDLETNETAVLGGDFYDREWRAAVQERLQKVRGRQVTVRVHKRRPGATYSKHHPPASEAVVILRQQSRPFGLGVSVTSPMLCPEVLTEPACSELLKRLGGDAPSLGAAYSQAVLKDPMFSMVQCLDMFTWRDYDRWGKKLVGRVLERIQASGKTILGGYLYVPKFSTMPDGAAKIERMTLKGQLLEHIEAATATASGKVAAWAVIHDAIVNTEGYTYMGLDSLTQALEASARHSETVGLYVSDHHALSSLSDIPMMDLVELITWLRQNGKIRVDGLMLGASLRRLDVGPQTLEKRLDYLSKRLPDTPFHITQLAVNMPKEELQRDMLRDCLLLFYSHPAVKTVSLGELWSPAAELPDMGYLRKDFSPKPSFQMVRKLFNEDWATAAELKTDRAGEAQCTLLEGTYQVRVAFETLNKTFTFQVPTREILSEPWKNVEGDGFTVTKPEANRLLLDIYLEPSGNIRKMR